MPKAQAPKKPAKVVPAEETAEKVQPEEVREETAIEDEPIDIIIVNDPSDLNYIGKIFVRQYSLEIHGEDYKALADQFCTKKIRNGLYLAVPASRIGDVEVRFREKKDAELHLDKQDPNAPIIDKVQRFSDKEEAVRFGTQKNDSTVVVSKVRSRKAE